MAIDHDTQLDATCWRSSPRSPRRSTTARSHAELSEEAPAAVRHEHVDYLVLRAARGPDPSRRGPARGRSPRRPARVPAFADDPDPRPGAGRRREGRGVHRSWRPGRGGRPRPAPTPDEPSSKPTVDALADGRPTTRPSSGSSSGEPTTIPLALGPRLPVVLTDKDRRSTMFRSLARRLTHARRTVFVVHPLQLSRWLDEAWTGGRAVPDFGTPRTPAGTAFLGDDAIVGAIDLPLPTGRGRPRRSPRASTPPRRTPSPATRSALRRTVRPWSGRPPRYAYLIECTGVFEVMAEVVRRFARRRDAQPPEPPAHPLGAGHRGAVLPRPAALLHRRHRQRGPAGPAGQPAQRLLADVRARAPAPGARPLARPGVRRRVLEAGRRRRRQHGLPGEVDRAAPAGMAGLRERQQRDRAQRHRPGVRRVPVPRAARHDDDAAAGRPAGPRGVRARHAR